MISVVIPVVNEERVLPNTLTSLFAQRGCFEVIVADGESSDDSVRIAREFPGVRVLTSPRGRAVQMNRGASVARGTWLLFLHADTLLPVDALAAIHALSENPAVAAGGFLHRFSDNDIRLNLISWINNQRCARTRIFYGDQAPFVRRSLFEELGGFPEQPILEDVLLMERVRAVTSPVVLHKKVTTDSRRFVQHGILRSFCRVFVIMSCYKLGLRIPARKFFAYVR